MTDLELIARHQAALREIDRLDAADYSAKVMRAMIAQSGPLPSYGPRTGTHPMATRIEPRPQATRITRIRPPLLDRDMDDFGTANRIIECAIHCLIFAAAIIVIAMILEFGA